MQSFDRLGKTALALLASAAVGLLIGVLSYVARESFGYQYPWGIGSPDFRVLNAIRNGLVSAAAIFPFLYWKKRPL
jgi:hypothetical protein